MRQGIKEKDIRDFEKYAKKLVDILERIREYNPDAMYFMDEEMLMLYGININNIDRNADERMNPPASVYMPGCDAGSR